jgi:NinB protein
VKYDLDNEAQALALMRSLWPKIKDALNAGRQLTLEIKPAKRTDSQNEKFHAIIGDIAKQAQHMGAKWDAEDWKRLLVDKFMRESWQTDLTIIPNLDSTGIVQLGIQTRKFTKEQASEFVEFLLAWSAENGVTINEMS